MAVGQRGGPRLDHRAALAADESRTKKCARCHIGQIQRRFRWLKRHNRGKDERFRDAWCITCRSEYKQTPTQRSKSAGRQRIRRLNDPAFRENGRLKSAAYYAKHRDRISTQMKRQRGIVGKAEVNVKHLDRRLKAKFGITLATYREMLSHQNNCCAICGCEDRTKTRRLSVDHDHATNKVRALLCHHCNTGLGNFRDNPALLLKAIEYLTQHKAS
jgi:hypothetical protein